MATEEDRRPNLYIVGFMGTGKTVVGRQVARQLRMSFIDSDKEIERKSGKRISDIFADEGEGVFRGLERTFVEDGHPRHGHVVSCGGGLITLPGMAEALKARGVVICLHASPETVYRRTVGNRKRPLLSKDNSEAQIGTLMARRESHYARAEAGISTDGRSIREVADHVIRAYRDIAARFRATPKSGNQ